MTTEQSSGIGFFSLLTILFIGLKLGGVINWSWMWVLSPLWISFSIWMSVLIMIILVLTIADNEGEKK